MNKIMQLIRIWGPQIGGLWLCLIGMWMCIELMGSVYGWLDKLKTLLGILAGWKLMPPVWDGLRSRLGKK